MSFPVSPLAHLRSRYPMATLITELAAVQEGTFVVRALVQVGGATIATGLAADADVEQAEERARHRAVGALELESDSSIAPTQWGAAEASFNSAPPIAVPEFSASEVLTGFAPSLEDDRSPTSPSALSTPIEPAEEPASIVADLYAHIQETKSEGEEEALPDISSLVVPASTLLNKTPRRRSEAPREVPPAPAPVDFSDVLAQTDVELRRLGWDARRGREYLKQTYSKRSRQELNEDELYDFLNYLKTQPSPSASPF